MQVTFVTLGMESIGVEMLSACLRRAGHRTSLAHDPALFDDRFQLHVPPLARLFDRREKLVEWILHLDPDLLAFSALTNTFSWCLEVAREVRAKKRIPTLFGGVHPSAVPDFVMTYDEIDFVCEGEGEHAIVALADALERGEDGSGIPNVWSEPGGEVTPPPSVDNFIQDLDELPWPDKELYAPHRPKRYLYRIITARGCPYRCTFCFNNHFATLPTETRPKDYLRRRSVDDVIEEFKSAKSAYDYAGIEFDDDIFTLDKEWLGEFLPRLKHEVSVPWFCETHANFVDDDLAKLMKHCGCIGAKMGIQSLDAIEYKRDVLKRVESEDAIVRAIDAFRAADLRLEVDHIFGLPGESREARERALAFYREHAPARVCCYWLTYFPGLEITNDAHARGELSDEQMDAIRRGDILWYYQVQAMTDEGRAELRENVGYMVAFDLMPYVPKGLRRRLNPRVLARVPFLGSLSRFVPAAQMLVQWRRTGYFDGIMYLRWYWHHMVGPGRRLHRVPKPGTRPTREIPAREAG